MRGELPSLETRADLRSYAETLAVDLDGRFGAFVCDADAGPDAEPLLERRSRERFGGASVVKVLIAYALYRRYDGRLEALERPRPISPENRVGGDGLFHLLSNPNPTIEDLSTAMIAISDNAATNELIDLLGFDRIANAAGELELEGTRLGRKMMHAPELDPSIAPGGDSPVFPEADSSEALEESETGPESETDGSDGHRYVNTVTPRDCVAMFSDIHAERTLSSAAYDRLANPFAEQNHASMVPRYLPAGIDVLHKTGGLPSVAADAGLLTVGERTVAYAFCCDGLERAGDGADAIAALGAGVYRLLERR